jgi:glycosyltransferase involved in cell wall biosynthesis
MLGFKLKPLGTRRKLSFYSVCRNLSSAISYYRIVVPFKTADDLGLAEHVIDDQDKLSDDARLGKFLTSDIHLYCLLTDKNIITRIRKFKSFEPKFHPFQKRMVKPPSVVYDADDDLEQIDIFNPRFCTLGTHLPDGTPLHRGAKINVEVGEGGEHHPLWEDGKTYGDGDKCDWLHNRKRLELYKASIRMAHGASCTTPNLATIFRSYGAQNVYVFPNSIRFRDYPEIKMEKNEKQVRVLWQGGWSHHRDWYPLRDSLARVSLKYDFVKFIIWGQKYRWAHDAIPPTRSETVDWIPHDAYILKLSTLNHDINLCPIADNRFNRCKSDIKFLESSSIYRPAASLVSDVAAYQNCIDGQTALKFKTPEEFEEKLCTLIEDAKLRKTLAENAKQWVKENRDAEKTVPQLLEWYRSMR